MKTTRDLHQIFGLTLTAQQIKELTDIEPVSARVGVNANLWNEKDIPVIGMRIAKHLLQVADAHVVEE